MSTCVECKQPVQYPRVYGDVCSRECGLIREGYERGRDEERSAVVAFIRDGVGQSQEDDVISVVIDRIQTRLSAIIERGEHEVKR